LNDGFLLCPILGYLVGSIPFGYLIARWIKGIDIRAHGSGNIGATNVGRVLGRPWFFVVFVLDFAKGVLPVVATAWFAQVAAEGRDISQHVSTLTVTDWATLTGLTAILGHMWPIYLALRGGKGVATAAGVVATLLPLPFLIALAAWLISAGIWRYVSLSSMLAAIILCVAQIGLTWPVSFAAEHRTLTLLCLAGTALVILRHRSNLGRLWRGQEPKIGQKHEQTGTHS
jgi:glycerol-3-phosphate acyltransferase PlsY